MPTKRRTLILASIAVLGATMTGFTAAPNALAATFPDNVCTSGPGQCLNLWNNNQNPGALVKWLHYRNSGGYNDWSVTVTGHVVGANCTNNCYPFYPGSGLNSRYNNDDIVTLTYWKNQGYCADQTDYEANTDYGNLEIQHCASGEDYQQFVWSGEGYLVAVYASDLQFFFSDKTNNPVWLGAVNGTGNGEQVSISTDQSWSKPFIFVSSGG